MFGTVYRKAQDLLTALDDRDLEKAYQLRDAILLNGELKPEVWMKSPDKEKVALILYALGQILSRNCLYNETTPARPCQLDRLDKALGLQSGADEIVRLPSDCSLFTAAHLEFYYAVSALHQRKYVRAVAYLEDVLRDSERLNDPSLQANAHFYLSTCDRKLGGRRNSAIHHLTASRTLLESLRGTEKRIAVVNIHQAWEEFNGGNFQAAVTTANHTITHAGSDSATLAHAQSLLARVERRRNHYGSAKHLIRDAIINYQKRDPHHRALARAHANLAHTNILLAKSAASAEREALLKEAQRELDRAEYIYAQRHYARETRPEVGNLRAMIAFQRGEFETAFALASSVHTDAVSRADYVEMSTAKIVQCMCILAGPREPLRGPGDKIVRDICKFKNAHDYAVQAIEAIEQLGKTKHARRQARAYIWLGIVILNPPYFDVEEAERCYKQATRLLPNPKNEAGYIGEELLELRRSIDRFGMDSSSKAMVYSVKASEILYRGVTWADIRDAFEEAIISFLLNNDMTYESIQKTIRIQPKKLSAITKRCQDKGMVSRERLQQRKGRKVSEEISPIND